VRLLPSLTVIGVLVAALLSTRTAPLDVVRYAGYVAWALVLPGVLVYRALRGVPRSLVDDLAMGTAVGMALEIAVWAVYSALDAARLLVTWPVFVVGAFCAVPALRRHVRRQPYTQPPPLAWLWTIAGITSVVIVYVWFVYLRGPAPLPDGSDRHYFHDLLYMLSLVGEAKHHFPLAQPQVADLPLNYHWFAYAHEASASTISGVDTPVVFFRLAVPTICVVSVALLAVAGWRITGKYWVGALAAGLMFVVAELSVSPISGTLSNVVLVGVWLSHAQAYTWIVLFPLLALVCDRLAGADGPSGADRPAWGRGGWVLLTLMCLFATGARATILPVVLGGLALVVFVQVIRRRLRIRTLAVAVPVIAAQAFATVVLFGFESSGFDVNLRGTLGDYVGPTQLRPVWKDAVVAGLVLGGYVIYMLLRTAGVAVLGTLASRTAPPAPDGTAVAPARWASPEWFLLGALLCGVAATLVLKHPTWGQVIFVRTSFVCGAILSAAGAVALIERRRVSSRLTAAYVAVAVVLSLGVFALGVVFDVRPRVPTFRAFDPIFFNVVCLGAAIGVGALAWPVLRRRWPAVRGTGAVLVLAVILGAGAYGIPGEIYRTQRYGSAAYSADGSLVTADRLVAARWLRANSDPDDVVAVNHKCEVAKPCSSGSNFWLEAFGERRLLVGNWMYAPRAVTEAVKTNTWLGTTFWDTPLLDANNAAFYAPTPELIESLHSEHNVRWFVVDRSEGHESPLLADLLTLRYEAGQILIYEVPDR